VPVPRGSPRLVPIMAGAAPQRRNTATWPAAGAPKVPWKYRRPPTAGS
jgi:hypothetical protein